MKKIAVIILLFVYGTTTVGATVQLHFCMNKFVGWDFDDAKKQKCNKCGMVEKATKKGCCKDEHKQLKLDSDHQKSDTACYFSQPGVLPAIIWPNYFQIATFVITDEILFHPPPDILAKNIPVLYCCFLI